MRRTLLVAACCLLATTAAAAAGSSRTGDPALKKALAFVDARCPRPERSIDRRMWERGWAFNALYGNCRAGDGTDQHVYFFLHGRFLGLDATRPSRDIIGLWRDDRTIAFLYVLYRPNDPNCCPTGGGKIVRFRLKGERMKALDPIPRNR